MKRPLSMLAVLGVVAGLSVFVPSSHANADSAPTDSATPVSFTAAQAAAGAKDYAQSCAQCHGTKLEGGAGPALGSLKGSRTVGGLYTFISKQMPLTDPGSLTPQVYTEITAFLLAQNGHTAGDKALTPASAKATTDKI